MRWFILQGRVPIEVSATKFLELERRPDNLVGPRRKTWRRIRRTEVARHTVWTEFTGMDPFHLQGATAAPFETNVTGPTTNATIRSRTWEEASRCHDFVVAYINTGRTAGVVVRELLRALRGERTVFRGVARPLRAEVPSNE